MVVKRASGQNFTAFLQRNVFSALNLSHPEMDFTIGFDSHASGYLERWSMLDFLKPFLIDRELIGARTGRWIELRPTM